MSEWRGCYNDGWKGLIIDEAFTHPAKFSRGLINRIYAHAWEMKWVKPEDWVLDPFGGVALGAVDALILRLNWVGVELEPRFCALGEQNIALWRQRLRGLPEIGTARIIRGDSRRLGEVVKEAGLIVSSPPFSSQNDGGGIAKSVRGDSDYPVFTGNARTKKAGISAKGIGYQGQGHTPGNLANLPEGKFEAVIGSPPFCDRVQAQDTKYQPAGSNHGPRHSNYGQSLGQLGSMREGEFDAVVGSPPYESDRLRNGGIDPRKFLEPERIGANCQATTMKEYGSMLGQIGSRAGGTFWPASHEIVSQCYELLKPGSHAIWVCKDYVKTGKRVPFSDRWLALCESVGFRLICRHRAMLVEEQGGQKDIFGGEKEIRTERKSFFRRLAEKKGSPAIDWEDVICLEKVDPNPQPGIKTRGE